MAIFKILKGASSRIGFEQTPFTEGYAYFTPDDGGFYIDSEVDGTQKRIRVNPPGGNSKAISSTLLAANWKDGSQTLQIPEVKAETNGIIGIAQDIDNTQLEAAHNAELYINSQKNGSLTISVYGETPMVDIPVLLILLG